MNIVALIPARSGSKRVANKNIRRLNHHPLLAYTIRAAVHSGIFSHVILSTDSAEYAEIGRYYGAECKSLRPAEFSQEFSRDIEWVKHELSQFSSIPDCFSILRPTSPFRQPETIQRAWEEFRNDSSADSLRAVQKVSEHPGKMWVADGDRMTPLLPLGPHEAPWHSSATQSLPPIQIQNASLEMAHSRVVFQHGTIAGRVIRPFFTKDREGLDVNTEDDWLFAEFLLERGLAVLPEIDMPPWA